MNPQPDLRAARARVLAAVAGSPMSQPPPRARASAPLRRLAPELEAKLAARAARDQLPTAVQAGRAGLLRRDPLRLTLAERRTIAAASRWDSKQQWTGPLAIGQERGLVIAAAREAERITRSPRWNSGALVEQRIRLDLGVELDQIDEQAHRIAIARQQQQAAGPAPDATIIDSAWESTVDRVAALCAYADTLDGAPSAPIVGERDHAVGNTDLLAGSALDELAGEQMLALWIYLDANRGDPFG